MRQQKMELISLETNTVKTEFISKKIQIIEKKSLVQKECFQQTVEQKGGQTYSKVCKGVSQ